MKHRVIAITIAVALLFTGALALAGTPVMAQQPIYPDVRECVDAHHNAPNVYEECKPGGKYNPYMDPPSEAEEEPEEEPETTPNFSFNFQFIWSLIWSFIWW